MTFRLLQHEPHWHDFQQIHVYMRLLSFVHLLACQSTVEVAIGALLLSLVIGLPSDFASHPQLRPIHIL
jgi:hypothetical protein